MKYSAIHNDFIISQKDLKAFSFEIKHAMADIRKALKVPLTTRKREGGLERIDHIERGILESCKSIGVDFGVEWGSDLDLSNLD